MDREQHESAVVGTDDPVDVWQTDAVSLPSDVIDEARGAANTLAPKQAVTLALQAGFLGAT